MDIGVVRMLVRQPLVPVRMAVARSLGQRRLVLVAMMLVVLVLMRVLERLVRMAVHVALGDMQPDARRHQRARG